VYKLCQNALRGRAPPGLAGGGYSTPPNPLTGFRGPTSKGRKGQQGREGEKIGRRGVCSSQFLKAFVVPGRMTGYHTLDFYITWVGLRVLEKLQK